MSGRAKWQAWEKASTEYAGKTDEEVESNYIEVVRTLGWTENATPRVEADASKSEDKEGTHGVGMGVSVSQIARPAEDAHQAEDSLHGAVLTKDESKVEEYLRKGHSSAFDIDQKDEYVSRSFDCPCAILTTPKGFHCTTSSRRPRIPPNREAPDYPRR